MKPVTNHVIIKEIVEPKVRTSGIEIPDTADKDKPVRGIVIDCGDDCKFAKPTMQVLFKKYAPEPFKQDGEDYLVVEETDILVIL